MKKLFAVLIVLSMVLVASAAFAGNRKGDVYHCVNDYFSQETRGDVCSSNGNSAANIAATDACRSVEGHSETMKCVRKTRCVNTGVPCRF